MSVFIKLEGITVGRLVVFIYIYTYIYTYISIHIYIYIHKHIYIYTYTYKYTYTYMYMTAVETPFEGMINDDRWAQDRLWQMHSGRPWDAVLSCMFWW